MASVPGWWMPAVRVFEQRADQAVAGLRVQLTSWGRTRAHNAKVGGATYSQHLVWTGADFAGLDQKVLMARARAVGLVAIDEGDHVHLQLFAKGQLPSWVFDYVAA